ncbi:hypothetical protein [Bradyrhizobium guangdongense]|nr:hypothetical protein [Bradyrhizobium guangdongense]
MAPQQIGLILAAAMLTRLVSGPLAALRAPATRDTPERD